MVLSGDAGGVGGEIVLFSVCVRAAVFQTLEPSSGMMIVGSSRSITSSESFRGGELVSLGLLLRCVVPPVAGDPDLLLVRAWWDGFVLRPWSHAAHNRCAPTARFESLRETAVLSVGARWKAMKPSASCKVLHVCYCLCLFGAGVSWSVRAGGLGRYS